MCATCDSDRWKIYYSSRRNISIACAEKVLCTRTAVNSPGFALVPGDPHLCGELHTGDQGHLLYLPEAGVAGF